MVEGKVRIKCDKHTDRCKMWSFIVTHKLSENNLCQTDRPIQKVIYRRKQFFFVTHKHRAYASENRSSSSSQWEWLSSNGHASSVSLPEPGRSAGPSDEFRDTDYSSPSSPLRVCTPLSPPLAVLFHFCLLSTAPSSATYLIFLSPPPFLKFLSECSNSFGHN